MAILIVLFVVLLVATITDIKWRIIPNELMLIGYGVAMIVLAQSPGWGWHLLASFLTIALLCVFTEEWQLGGGDLKLIGFVALCLSPWLTLLSLAITAAIVYVLAHLILKRYTIPLAPYLLAGTLAVLPFTL